MLSAAVPVGAQTITFDSITQSLAFPILSDGTVRVPTQFDGFVFDGNTEWFLENQRSECGAGTHFSAQRVECSRRENPHQLCQSLWLHFPEAKSAGLCHRID